MEVYLLVMRFSVFNMHTTHDVYIIKGRRVFETILISPMKAQRTKSKRRLLN